MRPGANLQFIDDCHFILETDLSRRSLQPTSAGNHRESMRDGDSAGGLDCTPGPRVVPTELDLLLPGPRRLPRDPADFEDSFLDEGRHDIRP